MVKVPGRRLIVFGRSGAPRLARVLSVALGLAAMATTMGTVTSMSGVQAAQGVGLAGGMTVPARLDTAGARQDESVAPAPVRRPLLEGWDRLEISGLALPARVAEPERLQNMADWNRAGSVPFQVGFVRRFARPIEVVLDSSAPSLARQGAAYAGGRLAADSDHSRISWTGRFHVEEARDVRLRLSRATLPPGTEVRVFGANGVPIGPVGEGLVDEEGSLWTPTVEGNEVWLEVSVPRASPQGRSVCRFALEEFAESFDGESAGASDGSAQSPLALETCLTDINCAASSASIRDASKGVGRMLFAVGGKYFVCTGGLLNDAAGSGTPYFLTARHCLSKQAHVSSLEVTWDYKTSGCGAPSPSLSSLPKSHGGALLASNGLTDSTLVRLTSVPGGRFFFGWSTDEPSGSTLLQRVSHPDDRPQGYSESHSNGGTMGECEGLALENFLYETMSFGGIAHGSSGAPVWRDDGIVVGQLLGLCGPNPSNSCLADNSQVDGRFSESYFSHSPWVGPPVDGPLPPENFRAASASKKRIGLAWKNVAADHDRYEVLQLQGDTWATIAQKGKRAQRAGIGGLTSETIYRFGVRACQGSACSAIVATPVATK